MNVAGHFAEQGYVGPMRVLSALECDQFRRAIDNESNRPLDWDKGWAVTSRPFYELCSHPKILEVVTAVVGEDVMLWGASIQDRPAGAVHPWHTDIESAVAAGKTVAVWIGLQHSHRDSALQFLSYSHRFGVSVQELRQQAGICREHATAEDILRWARERDARSCIVQSDISDGEALFFDGTLWHCSHNRRGATRRALLLQYATPETPIHIPDLTNLDWPFRKIEVPRPACIILQGNDIAQVNRIVPAPIVSARSSR